MLGNFFRLTCPRLFDLDTVTYFGVLRNRHARAGMDVITDTTQYHCPSGLPEAEEREIRRIVVQAYRSLGCRGWARTMMSARAQPRHPSDR